MAVWLEATYCIAQLVQPFGMSTLPTATMNRCRHSVASSSKRRPERERGEAEQDAGADEADAAEQEGGSACTPMLATR